MDSEMKRIISIIEDIEETDGAISLIDYDIYEARSKGLEASIPGMEDVFNRLRRESNNTVNNLKAEGIELEWDGKKVYVRKDGQPYIKRVDGKWEVWTYQLPLIG